MKNFFKRFKLSEWLILSQLLLSAGTLLLTTVLGDTIVDLFGLIGNIINGIAILVVFSLENSRNVKYYELTGQFIFNKLGDSFSSFMDFLMSDEYKKMPFDEHNILHEKLVEIAKGDNYDLKRKVSRALPYLYEVDKKMTFDLMAILRKDLYQERTDIRRRTLEAMVTILQKEPKTRKRHSLANKFIDFFCYHDYDDSYTVVACIECYYFLHDYVYSSSDDKQRCRDGFEMLKKSVLRAHEAEIGVIDNSLCSDMDNIWQVLVSLSCVKNINSDAYVQCKKHIEGVILAGAKYSKLTVVKNLFYTCPKFPECLHSHSCSATGSKYMMEKIRRFLSNALDQDVYLAMPTVRYFDCVCNNIGRGEAKETARTIIREYYTSDELIITQTAFDKFAMLMANDRDFAKEILSDLLEEENRNAAAQTERIRKRINSLPEECKLYYSEETGRTKFKPKNDGSLRQRAVRQEDPNVREIDEMIRLYNERMRFIGKIKKVKEDHGL